MKTREEKHKLIREYFDIYLSENTYDIGFQEIDTIEILLDSTMKCNCSYKETGKTLETIGENIANLILHIAVAKFAKDDIEVEEEKEILNIFISFLRDTLKKYVDRTEARKNEILDNMNFTNI